jgi:hypothetical protein
VINPTICTVHHTEVRLVTLQECANPDTGAIGKCCRDPNYEDPWPGGMMMKKNGDGQQPDECGVGAACLHSYECGSQYRIQPTRVSTLVSHKHSHTFVERNAPE